MIASQVALHLGDSKIVLRELPDCSAHSICTDPPYELGFMGKKWDASGIAYDVALWRECLRVLKPGGHLLAFGGSRTYHRMASAIEDAGFEIRDQIMWLYSSGFPKSLDVSKAIDKAGGLSPKEQSLLLRTRREASGLSRAELADQIGCTLASVRDWEEGRARAVGMPVEFIIPSEAYRDRLADLLGYSQDERKRIGVAQERREDGTIYGLGHSGTLLSGSNTALSQQWAGRGTALKPAHEPIVVARKPLIGTVVENVLAHGTGALNIDGCRVETDEVIRAGAGGLLSHVRSGKPYPNTREGEPSANRRYSKQGGTNFAMTPGPRGGSSAGRWPANVIHDGSEEVRRAFPDAPGQQGVVTGDEPTANGFSGAVKYSGMLGRAPSTPPRIESDRSAARFFYCAKANRKDREDGNDHPTVKPTELMRYLCRLVTPPGGVVLDPFMGSGSTGKAAVLEGFRFIGIEREPDYFEIAKARIENALTAVSEPSTPTPKVVKQEEAQQDLFSFTAV